VGLGDCAGSPNFTHISFDDFRVVRDNITGGNRVTTGRQVPFCLFTDPEFARIGLSEKGSKGARYCLSSRQNSDGDRLANPDAFREAGIHGLMQRRYAIINDLPIRESDRKFFWPLGRRPDDHPGLSHLNL
jgi:hypothetical protein